jgi:outer membrane protein TolC
MKATALNTHTSVSTTGPALGLAMLLSLSTVYAQTTLPEPSDYLTLQQAEHMALTDEPGLVSQQWLMKSRLESAVAEGQLSDPKIQLGLLNMPTDTFDFDQEPVTQLRVSYIQQFPSGDTLALKQQKSETESEVIKSKMLARKLDILKKVRLTYLESFYWERARDTILQNRSLFSQLIDIVQSLFSVGRNDQQDLIRAQLELSRLDDRLVKINQNINVQRTQLARWTGESGRYKAIAEYLPEFAITSPSEDTEEITSRLLPHPEIAQLDREIELKRKDIQLVNESLKTGYGLNISYSYRDDTPTGVERADFISAAVTFDLPFFSENRQDRKRLAREHEYQALKNSRQALLRRLITEYQQYYQDEQLLTQRYQLYRDQLLPQSGQQSEAALLAYQSDRGTFSDVIRAYIDNLNAKLDERRIATDIQKARAQLLYLSPDIIPAQNSLKH